MIKNIPETQYLSVAAKEEIIIFMEQSTSEFHRHPNHYIHHGTQVFNSGVELDMLQEYIYVTLDTFRDLVPDPNTELEAWLAFISARDISEIDHIIDKFPHFQIIKDDVILYGETNPEEVLHMYIDGIEIFDRNDRINDLKETKAENEQLRNQLAEKDAELAHLKELLAAKS